MNSPYPSRFPAVTPKSGRHYQQWFPCVGTAATSYPTEFPSTDILEPIRASDTDTCRRLIHRRIPDPTDGLGSRILRIADRGRWLAEGGGSRRGGSWIEGRSPDRHRSRPPIRPRLRRCSHSDDRFESGEQHFCTASSSGSTASTGHHRVRNTPDVRVSGWNAIHFASAWGIST